MNIFIAGATGVLGRRLVQQYSSRGHQVVGLVRSEDGEQLVRSLGGTGRYADLFDSQALAQAAEGSDLIIHAATAIPVKARTGMRDWQLNDRIRREGTQALVTAAAQVKAKAYLQQSTVWVAQPADGSAFDEDTAPAPAPVHRSAWDGENVAREAGERYGFSVLVLRCGMFYAPDSAHTRLFGEALRRRRLPVVGRGDAIWAMVHADDAAHAFAVAAEESLTGTWHVVDNGPATMSDFLRTFAYALEAPEPRRVPVWLARVLVGRQATEFMTASTRTSNRRFLNASSWRPSFPSIREGLRQVARAWQEEGIS
ncbi:MAG: NAD-dependent epimerase/dehydratase family protein [Dehalococcoidia bacterium]